VVVVGFVAVVVLAIGAIGSWPAGPTPWRVEISIRYSRFEPARLSVPAGRPVTFVLRNEDPIDHEWLIGDEQMHQRHRTGTEPFHDSRPTEVSIPPLTTIETTVVFDGQVTWRYVCHLPGHEAYGMVGVLTSH
jgi:uncharacterized cupredoxin-like copper-binding protein